MVEDRGEQWDRLPENSYWREVDDYRAVVVGGLSDTTRARALSVPAARCESLEQSGSLWWPPYWDVDRVLWFLRGFLSISQEATSHPGQPSAELGEALC